MFLEISQNSQKKHLCQSLFFNKGAGLKVSLHIYNFCSNLNYREIIADYKCVSSTYISLLFSITFLYTIIWSSLENYTSNNTRHHDTTQVQHETTRHNTSTTRDNTTENGYNTIQQDTTRVQHDPTRIQRKLGQQK